MVFPVEDLDSCISVVRAVQQPDDAPSPPAALPVATAAAAFRECVLVRPNSTLADIYQVLQHCGFERLLLPEPLVCQAVGDADAAPASNQRVSLKKADLLPGRIMVLKLSTNLRKEWQRASHAR